VLSDSRIFQLHSILACAIFVDLNKKVKSAQWYFIKHIACWHRQLLTIQLL